MEYKKGSATAEEMTAHTDCYYAGYIKGIQEERLHCINMIRACIRIHEAKGGKDKEISALNYAIGMIDGGV